MRKKVSMCGELSCDSKLKITQHLVTQTQDHTAPRNSNSRSHRHHRLKPDSSESRHALEWPLGPRVELRSTLSAVRTIVHSLRAHPHTYLKRCALVRMCPSPSRSRVRAKVRSSPSQETSRTSQYLYLPIVYLRAGARATGDCTRGRAGVTSRRARTVRFE